MINALARLPITTLIFLFLGQALPCSNHVAGTLGGAVVKPCSFLPPPPMAGVLRGQRPMYRTVLHGIARPKAFVV